MQKRIILKDHLNHQKYDWPVTMLSYPVVFDEAVKESCWELRDAQGDMVPYQISDVQRQGDLVKGLTLSFLSGLRKGECKEYCFQMHEESLNNDNEKEFVSSFGVEIDKENGIFSVTCADKKMVCSLPFDSLEYRIVQSGCIYEEIEIICKGNNNQEYILNVRRIAEMPFWELKESMCGFDSDEQMEMNISFEGFDFTHRHSWARPVEKVDDYLREDNRLPVVVMPFESHVPWFQSKYIGFSGEDYSAGLFIRDNLEWDDGKYPIWGSNRDFGITFSYENEIIKAHFPLKNGKRFVGISAYEGAKADYVESLWKWYAYFHLDKVKTWVLDWDEDQKQYPKFFNKEQGKPIQARGWHYRKGDMLCGSTMTDIIDQKSPCVNVENGPVSNREFADWVVIIDLTADEMTREEFARTKAWFAFMGYACKDENYMPIENMLAGHPNFLADTASVPGFVAALFPNHPEKEMFRQYFNKVVSLNMKYHIRPDVAAYGSLGGRETENLACYSFAMLRPFLHVCKLYEKCGYSIPLVCENGAKWLNWMNNGMSAPVNGKRMKLPQGAHARKTSIPYALYELAQLLEKDYPEVSRNTYAICAGDPLENFEYASVEDDIWRTLVQRSEDKGVLTLKTEKFTGYGCILREAVGTPDEISVHVQQLDLGPNYRWGCFENTGNGGIHYYAAGKRYSFNAVEDTGDKNLGAEEGNCGFAVLKGHTYHNIGFQDLTEPLRDFPMIKQTKLMAGNNINDYYKYRRVSLVEKDYIVIYDAVTHMRAKGRFLWTVNLLEEFPAIWQLRPGANGVVKENEAIYKRANVDWEESMKPEQCSKTIAFDGTGNFLTVVSHRNDIEVHTTEYGATVEVPGRKDYIFEDSALIRIKEPDYIFKGYSGMLSCYKDGICKGALLEGKVIGNKNLKISLNAKGAICFEGKPGRWKGVVVADGECVLQVNGKVVSLSQGAYKWTLDDKLTIEELPKRKYSGINGFVRDTRRHEPGFLGYDFEDTGEILTYPAKM